MDAYIQPLAGIGFVSVLGSILYIVVCTLFFITETIETNKFVKELKRNKEANDKSKDSL